MSLVIRKARHSQVDSLIVARWKLVLSSAQRRHQLYFWRTPLPLGDDARLPDGTRGRSALILWYLDSLSKPVIRICHYSSLTFGRRRETLLSSWSGSPAKALESFATPHNPAKFERSRRRRSWLEARDPPYLKRQLFGGSAHQSSDQSQPLHSHGPWNACPLCRRSQLSDQGNGPVF